MELPFTLDLITLSRLIQALLAILTLSLSASVIHFFNTHTLIGPAPSYLVFTTFLSTFTLLFSLPYTTFTPVYFPAYINRWASLGMELLTTILWFGAFVPGAVYLSKLKFCIGMICNNARAGVVFSALLFATFCVTSWFPVKYCFFDDENQALGDRNWTLGMNGAERITRARMRRDAMNNARVKADREGKANGEKQPFAERAGELVGVWKVRLGNAVQEWKVKAGRGDDSEEDTRGNREMSERTTRTESMV